MFFYEASLLLHSSENKAVPSNNQAFLTPGALIFLSLNLAVLVKEISSVQLTDKKNVI